MDDMKNEVPAPIYIVSGGFGLAGNQMVQSLLIQYPENRIPILIHSGIDTEEKLLNIVKQAKQENALITHTMVNPELRKKLRSYCTEHNVKNIDFMGELAAYLDTLLDVRPLQRPGLYRKVNQEYFERIDAIEFTLSHDDGMNHEKLHKADIVLTGVSRVGKTPLSVYLAMYGWKVANVPLVNGINPPKELFEIDPKRVFGLHIGIAQLIAHRRKRLETWSDTQNQLYVDEQAVKGEIKHAMFVFQRGNFTILTVTNKPIESTASEILNFMSKRFSLQGRQMKPPH